MLIFEVQIKKLQIGNKTFIRYFYYRVEVNRFNNKIRYYFEYWNLNFENWSQLFSYKILYLYNVTVK